MSNLKHKRIAVMFDLDGTLADTLADIHAAANHALTQLGRPTIDAPRTGELIGHGVERLIVGALGPRHADKSERGIDLFRTYYAEHGLDFTKPYPGIPEMLDELVARGIRMAVFSNKVDEAVQQVITTLFKRWKFDVAVGQLPGAALKPDPQVAHMICDKLRIPPAKWLYVGDSDVDMQTGRNAGMLTIGVPWGFRSREVLQEAGAQAIIEHPSELLRYLD